MSAAAWFDRDPVTSPELSTLRARTGVVSSFIRKDCAVWISQLLGAVQRRDGALVAGLCRSMRPRLRVIGADNLIGLLGQLEASCFSYGTRKTFMLSRTVMDELIRVVDSFGPARLRKALPDARRAAGWT